MIPTIIVWYKINTNIPKSVRASMNQSIPVVKEVEPDVCLAKRARLDGAEANPLFISQKIL